MIEKLFEKDRAILTYGTVVVLNRHLRSAVIQTSGGVNFRVVYPAEYDGIEVGDSVILAGRTIRTLIAVSKDAGTAKSSIVIV